MNTTIANSSNPLLNPSQLFDEAIPFDQIKTEHFLPALEEAIKISKKNIESIKEQTAAPTFDNTILALETCGQLVEKISEIYFNLFNAEGDEKFQALAKQIGPMVSGFANDIFLDEKLFNRVKTIYENREQMIKDTALVSAPANERLKIIEYYYQEFTRNGALLDSQKKEQLRKLDDELSKLGPRFSENVLKSTNAFLLLLDSQNDLAGLPTSAIDAAAQTAKEKGHTNKWAFTLQAPSVVPFLAYSERRDLRQKVFMAFNSRAFRDANDNQETLLRINRLRHDRAKLLGYKNYAHFTLEKRMARTNENVENFLKRLIEVSKKAAQQEINELETFAKNRDNIDKIMPWDVAFYGEKLKEEKFKFNQEDLRPYFKLENVVEGVFKHAQKLYGLEFKQRHDIPVYHADVKVFEVTESSTKNYIGLFYVDFFPRDTKKSGAWMTDYRRQGYENGKVKHPHASIVCNFTKPTDTKPSLLTLMEVETLFHEFGHSLHGLLSHCTFRSIAGTNVYWDFVELPSQIMENWCTEKEGLELFARHYETNEMMPDDLINKIKQSSRFMAGYYSLRQLNFGTLDWAWFGNDPGEIKDVEAFELQATSGTQILPKVDGINTSCAFSHIFAGGYSAGYYSYKWAEVLDADAFELFKQEGLFNQTVAKSFKDNILSRGATEHPMELYKRFRGREPDPDALLRRDGLL